MNGQVITVTLNPALDKTVSVDGWQSCGLNRVRSSRLDAGGKGINVAKALKKFGIDAIAAGLNAGYTGLQLLRLLERDGIRTAFMEAEGETRVNMKIVDSVNNGTTEVNESGFSVDEALLARFEKMLLPMTEQAQILVISGSLPQGVPASVYRKYVEAARVRGVKAVLDADGEALAEGIKGTPYAIKPNIHELEKLLGRSLVTDEQVVEAGRELLRQGIQLVIVSMGGDGSILLTEQACYRAHPFPITPKSTVGAGDSMVAALVYCMLGGMSPEETARWTTAAGTVTASRPGTEVCSLQEVRERVTDVRLQVL